MYAYIFYLLYMWSNVVLFMFSFYLLLLKGTFSTCMMIWNIRGDEDAHNDYDEVYEYIIVPKNTKKATLNIQPFS